MKIVDYIDGQGRQRRVQLPDDRPDSDAPLGVEVGIIAFVIDSLNLPDELALRLHNSLFDRGLFTAHDVQKNPNGLTGAVMSALKLDASRLYNAYVEVEKSPSIDEQSL